MQSELVTYRDQLEKLELKVVQMLEGLTEQQLHWKPSDSRWSVAQCIEHLTLTGEAMLKDIQENTRLARQNNVLSNGPYRHPFIGKIMMKGLRPPVKMRIKAAPILVPNSTATKNELSSRFAAMQAEFRNALSAADGLDLGRIRFPLVAKKTRISLGQAFQFTVVHEERHIWQAEQVMLMPDFK